MENFIKFVSTIIGLVLGVYLVNMFFEKVLGMTTGFSLIIEKLF